MVSSFIEVRDLFRDLHPLHVFCNYDVVDFCWGYTLQLYLHRIAVAPACLSQAMSTNSCFFPGIISGLQFSIAHSQNDAISPSINSSGGICPRKRIALTSGINGSEGSIAVAHVCLLSFSPLALTATGRCIYTGV